MTDERTCDVLATDARGNTVRCGADPVAIASRGYATIALCSWHHEHHRDRGWRVRLIEAAR